MTDEVATVRCYIEEYDVPTGKQGLRLREKVTNRRVDLGPVTPVDQQQFLQFLVAGAAHRAAMPTLFDSTDPTDCVLVSGHLTATTAATLTFDYDKALSYLGYTVSTRGRIPATVLEAYDAQ